MHAKKAAPAPAAPGLGGESQLGTRKGRALTGGSRASATEGGRERGVGGLGRGRRTGPAVGLLGRGERKKKKMEKGEMGQLG